MTEASLILQLGSNGSCAIYSEQSRCGAGSLSFGDKAAYNMQP